MTTHSMDEADILSDRIVVIGKLKKLFILVDGMLKCIGNSLYLKNNFGGGYKISIVVYLESDVEILRKYFSRIFPTAKLIDCSGTQLIYALAMTEIK